MTCGVVAVAAGAGMRRLYEQLGAYVVEGGATLNPSTFEILAGIHEVAAPEVVVLPNSGNVILAAERAAELSEKEVAVVDSRWQQAGLACLVEHDPDAGLEENVLRLRSALADMATGAVAPAAREDKQGRFAQGDAVGFVDEEIVAWGTPEATLAAVLGKLAEGREILTCVCGADAPLEDDVDRRPCAGGRGAGAPRRRPASLLVADRGGVAARRTSRRGRARSYSAREWSGTNHIASERMVAALDVLGVRRSRRRAVPGDLAR